MSSFEHASKAIQDLAVSPLKDGEVLAVSLTAVLGDATGENGSLVWDAFHKRETSK